MSVSLTSNFLLNARGLTFATGGGLAWSFNPNTNTLTATGSAGAVLSSVGLTSTDLLVTGSPLIVNGSIVANLVAQTGVTAGNYTYASLTVNSKGVVTAVSSGTQPVTSIGSSNLSIGGTAVVPTVNLSSTQVTNIGLGATALQSITVTDSISGAGTVASPLELAGDAASPGNSFYYGTNVSGTKGWYASLAKANPSATVGLSAVNGATGNYMDAGSAPGISQAIIPTWTGLHTFNGKVVVNAPAAGTAFSATGLASNPVATFTSGSSATGGQQDVFINRAGSTANGVADGPCLALQDTTNTTQTLLQQSGGQTELWQFNGSWTQIFKVLTSHGIQFTGPIGWNGMTPPAQVTGFGTPTTPSVVASFSGTAATTAQMQATIAQILTIMKAHGMIGA